MKQIEIDKPVNIIDSRGFTVNLGWAKSPFFLYNDSSLIVPHGIISSFDKYIIFSNSFMFVFELCNNGDFGFLNVTAVSLLDKHILSKNIRVLFPMEDLTLPPSSETGSVKFMHKNNLLEFIIMEKNTRIIKIDIPQIGHNRRLRGEVVLIEPPNAQSVYTLSSWQSENRKFKFLRCSPWWIVEGVMQFENTDMAFYKDRAWGIFYWNRIVRPKSDIHYWAAGCGLYNGRQISFNLGYGTDNFVFGTENAFFIDGVLYKLELVTFQISPVSLLKPWNFTSNDKCLEMTFFPLQEHYHSHYIFFRSDVTHQIFGFFSGRLTLTDGSIVYFNKITGITELRKTKH
ncbi:MAG: DUF2804 domain-containing protein [Spirochaetaceae bacterium]|jgi:hypothetical protein|nr:DUF2804 domain-containing protein [Spirochaetaceae bacterium]